MAFQEIKESCQTNFNQLICLLETIDEAVCGINKTNPVLLEFLNNNSSDQFKDDSDSLKNILAIICRAGMKCAFFGKTSNGKSASINCLLGDKVLPSSKGRTTSSFINLKGCEEHEGFLIDKNNQRRELASINNLANELSGDSYDINSTIHLFWPKSRCHLLRNDLELFDSPGVDYSSENDVSINNFCENSDVFVLIVDGCSTLNESEKSFFRRVKRIISNPNVFVLINKWDLVDEDRNKIRKQHLDEVSKFLVQDLKLYTTHEIDSRIFFISAVEALRNDGPSEYTESFQNFQNALETELNANAIKTKFKHHIIKVLDIANKVLEFLNEFQRFVHQIRTFDCQQMDKKLLDGSENLISTVFGEMVKESKRIVAVECPRLTDTIQKAIDKQNTYLEKSMHIMEEALAKSITALFKANLNHLFEELKNLFSQNSYIKLTVNQMAIFFKEHLDTDNVIDQVDSFIQINITNSAKQMKDVIQAQEAQSETYKNVRKILKLTPTFLIASGTTLLKLHPNLGAGLCVVGLIAKVADQALSENDKNAEPDTNINDELMTFFNLIIETCLQETDLKINKMVSEAINAYVIQQENMHDLLETFQSMRSNCEDIISNLEVEQVKIMTS